MAVDRGPTFFFIHVMKTGGTTFGQHIKANFPPQLRYPVAPEGAPRRAEYTMIDSLREFARATDQVSSIRMFSGHFPFVATTLVDPDVRLTMLRDPVARTMSALRHLKRYVPRHADRSLEEIYEDEWSFPMMLHDYQVKQFAMTADDRLESHMDVIDIDEGRLRTAIGNLERIDVLGLAERYSDFVDAVQRRYGWRINAMNDRRVSTEDWALPSGFERRIADDNPADMEFYAHALRIHGRR